MGNKFYKKKVLVAGGTGLIGQQLTSQLIELEADVYVSSLDNKDIAPKGIKDYYQLDMTIKENCKKVCVYVLSAPHEKTKSFVNLTR